MLLIGWDTSKDSFEVGQWFKGRIYERRCDLSPNGDLLLYFAANYARPLRSWSAISRPPFLSALALWPKGDGWGGGGHFLSKNNIALNHRAAEMKIADGYPLPRSLKIKPFGEYSGRGEDDPVWSTRLKRDGWTLINFPTTVDQDFQAKVTWELSPPITWRKPNPKWPKRYELEMSYAGIGERNGAWYMTEHSLVRDKTHFDKIGKSDWADWDRSGDLLFAMDGCLYRLGCENGVLKDLEDATKVSVFTTMKFESREAPKNALRWPKN